MCIDVSSSNFICVDSSIVDVPISLPLATAPLGRVVDAMKIILRHNFVPCCYPPPLLPAYSETWTLPYPPVLFEQSQTGKTTTLQLALSLFGCNKKTFFSKRSKESYLQKCSQSTFPVGCDDPLSPKAVGQLVVEFDNGQG